MPPDASIQELLDQKVRQYNQPGFIETDPIAIPHEYSLKQDVEITAFITAVLAWGQRVTILNKCRELFSMMDQRPYDFILHHQESDLKPLTRFKHRTFNTTDTLYFISFLKHHYGQHDTLEHAFQGKDMETRLIRFHQYFFSLPYAPDRTRKHIPTPARKSTCKRLNMFLRWMVRKDDNGVDFGIWENISPSDLICPVDVHVDRVARQLGLIERKQTDWLTTIELTEALRELDPVDPVKYDFALFGLGVHEKF